MTEERRHFNRVAFETAATFYSNSQETECQVVDLSLHGALLRLITPVEVTLGGEYRLEIRLGEEGEVITMQLELTHQEGEQLGLKCVHIDLDSITHLRRLVELNLGDSELLERDFIALCEGNN